MIEIDPITIYLMLLVYLASTAYSCILYFRNKKLKDDVSSMESRLDGEVSYRRRLVQQHENEMARTIINNNLGVGAIFYYPSGCGFKGDLVGKRAKVVKIEGGRVYSRLVDDKNQFLIQNEDDDTLWNGSVTSSRDYIYVNKTDKLTHVFFK